MNEETEARQQWLEERRKAIGASDTPGVLGVSPWSSPLSVWASKVGLAVEEFSEEAVERMRWGQVLEPIILEEYTRKRFLETGENTETSHAPQDEVCRHPGYPAIPMACTPDGEDSKGRIVQIKNVDSWMADEWRDGAPLHVIVQEQHEMAVLERSQATIVALIGDHLVYEDVDRDDDFISMLETKLPEWWERYVVNKIEPPVDASDSSVRTLGRLHPADSGAEVYLSDEFIEHDERLVELKAQIKAFTEEREEIENRIKSAIGDATFGRLPNRGGRYSWKSQDKKEYRVKASTSRVLRRHKR